MRFILNLLQDVTIEEEGIYHCVSKGVKNNDINIRSVRVLVKQDWAEVEAHDPGVSKSNLEVFFSTKLVKYWF